MDRLVGVLLIAVSASCFGAMAIFARLAYEAGTDPITVLFLRFTIAAIFMSTVMAVKGIAFPRGRTLISLTLMGALGYVGFSLAFFTARQWPLRDWLQFFFIFTLRSLRYWQRFCLEILNPIP